VSLNVKGIPQLRARLEAIKPNPQMMRNLALSAVREQKLLVPRKTGNLGRSIVLGRVTSTMAETVATANYAAFVELGTRPHTIVPRQRKALRFAAGGNATLSGRPRAGSSVIFTKRVRHPGTRAQPYMVPGAKRAVERLGVESIVKQWNDAA
jgi:hypothetical protein